MPFTLSTSNVKAVFGLKISKYRIGPKIGGFLRERGVNVKFWFCDPEKAHLCPEPRLLTYFASKFVGGVLAVRDFLNQKNSRVNNLVREVVHARKQNPLTDLD